MSRSNTSTKIIQGIFVASLLFPLVSTYLLALAYGYKWLPLNYSLIGLVIAGYVGIQHLARRGKNVNWFLSLAMLNLLLLTPELLLRQADFHYEMGVQFGYPNPTQFESFIPDKDLFWRLPPERPGVNSLGFWGKEIEVPKPSGVYRIMFLGDSVPRQGYPTIVDTLLNAHAPEGMRFESANLATAGYSTYQGRILADKYGDLLEPNLVFLSYGWNDHWQAYGDIDSRKSITVDPSSAGKLLRTIYQHSRVLQWLRYAFASLGDIDHPLTEVRVPVGQYRANLIYIGEFFAARNVPVIFITPPSAHPTLGVPDYLIVEGFAANKENVMTLHQAYNQIVRDVAMAHNWLILDLEQEFASLGNPSEIFIEDGIHLTPDGSALVARHIAEFISANRHFLFQY